MPVTFESDHSNRTKPLRGGKEVKIVYSRRSFRARFLEALVKAGLSVPDSVPRKSVVDYTRAGTLTSEKDIYLDLATSGPNGLVQLQDKIVDRFALTIYSYSSGRQSRQIDARTPG